MPKDDEQRAMSAVLDSGDGAVLSHRSAAATWGLPGFDMTELEVSRPRTGANRATGLAQLHHPCDLPAHHCTTRDGLPVTTLARTVFDLTGTEHPGRAERALHAALRAGLRWTTIENYLNELARRGRPGIELMRELLAAHAGRPAMGSGLEARFLRLLLNAGLPQPRRQVDLGTDDWAGRVDFLYNDSASSSRSTAPGVIRPPWTWNATSTEQPGWWRPATPSYPCRSTSSPARPARSFGW